MADRMVKRNGFDIREYKKALRKKFRAIRTGFAALTKAEKDRKIFQHVRSMPLYTKASVVLCYVSISEEIYTHDFIRQCLKDGKTVAVPYCIANSREMDFYCISSIDTLQKRSFGVLEPVAEESIKLEDFTNSICILPGIAFDKQGYRLGYGGGYYDRFLSQKYNGYAKIGVCYRACIQHPPLIRGKYDVPCDYLVTEHGVRKIGGQRASRRRKNRKKKTGT